MKAILKKDFYENFKSTILSIIYILALSISLNLVNYATSKVFFGEIYSSLRTSNNIIKLLP